MGINRLLSQRSLVVVFTYARAGLGHLRVTDAIHHGLPKEVTPLLLGSQDISIGVIHRIMSVHPIARAIMEWTQRGLIEDIFTASYRKFLRSNTHLLYQQITTLLDQRIDLPKIVLVIATHFGLAHQLAEIKKTLESIKKVKIILVVQVSDDTIQHIWYVPGADLTFVPSEKTKEGLLAYGRQVGLAPIDMEVLPYPVSPFIGDELSAERFQERIHQVDKENRSEIHVAMPISGAAVGTDFNAKLMERLHKKSDRFVFHIVAKSVPYTANFLNNLLPLQYTDLEVALHDREIVDRYELLYRRKVISLEVTKPSEQAFKALFAPEQIGGSILLFSRAVGRQEYDNLDFLRRHTLVPLVSEKQHLWEKAFRNQSLEENGEILKKAAHWRGIEIPDDPEQAADFIWWCLNEKIFLVMMRSFIKPEDQCKYHDLGSDGVALFWKRVAQLVEEKGI